MTVELYASVRLCGDIERARELLDRSIATGLISCVVYALTVKDNRLHVGFSDRMESTSAERACAVAHIAGIAREMGLSTRIVFDSHQDWLKGFGMKETNGEAERL